MKRHIIIVAGGSGSRMGAELPKQFLLLGGRPVLMHTLERFRNFDKDADILLVLPSSEISRWSSMISKHNFAVTHEVVEGGSERFFSVRNGLAAINAGDSDLVAIHDGVRPLVSHAVVESSFAAAAEHGAAIPVVEPSESVRVITLKGSMAVNRDTIRLVQTPQVFRYRLIASAYQQQYRDSFTDDASVAEAAGNEIVLVEGNRENIKITTPVDLLLAEMFMRSAGDSAGR